MNRRQEARSRTGRSIRRRTFLTGLGLGALAPFVPLLDVEAEPLVPTKRLILFYSPFGTAYEHWVPTGSGANFSLTGSITAPLEPHKKDIVILDGVYTTGRDGGVGDPHQNGMAALWTGSKLLPTGPFHPGADPANPGVGWGTGISLDQYVAEQWNAGTRLKSLELGVNVSQTNPNSRMCYAGENKPITPQQNPRTAFESTFEGISGESAIFAQLRAERKSVLDLASKQLGRLQPKISSHDRHKLDAHLDAIRAIEHKLDATVGSCTPGELPGELDVNNSGLFMDMARLQIDIMVHAMACDLTRVGSIQLKDENGGTAKWIGQNWDLHALSHETTGTPATLHLVYRDFHVLFGELLQRLRDTETASGSHLLDDTLVAYGSANANGSHRSGKFPNEPPLPMILAGKAGGALQTGRVLHYNTRQAHHRLLVSMCHLLDVPAMSGDKFGNIDPGSGPLSGLV